MTKTLRESEFDVSKLLAGWSGLLRRCLFLSLLSAHGLSYAVASPAEVSSQNKPSLQAQRIFEAVRPSVIQVQTLPISSDSPSSYGTGFAVGANNLIVTNYHVVSSVVMDPERYRLEFIHQDGRKGSLSIVAIDVVNDLAVVRGETGPIRGLMIDESVPEKGARGFSIGFPENQGITVTEGIINGLSEDSVRGAIHFTGPINSGMSGGPAVNSSGQVFGINVSHLRDSQMISFVVPSRFAIPLVEKAQKIGSSTAKDIFKELNQQLKSNSSQTLELFPQESLPVQRLGQFEAPARPGDFARCFADNEKEADKLYAIEVAGCNFKDQTYVNKDLYLGGWAFSYSHITAPDLGAIRFASLQEAMMHVTDDTSAANRLHKTHWSCRDNVVNSSGTRTKSVLCLRRYLRFETLYDIELKMATIDNSGETLVTNLSLTGFAYPESMAFSKRFMEAISWKP